MTERTTRRINTDALVKLCDRLDMQAAILAIMGGEQIDVDLYLKASTGLREALAEIERLRSDHLKTASEVREAHLKTAAALREAIAENERLRLDAVAVPPRSDVDAELYRSKLDLGMNTPTFWPTDWFLKLLSPYNAKNGLK
jgi:hypothetical protein